MATFFKKDIILLTVRWYLRYALSYRDLEEMKQARGLSLDHTTIYMINMIRNGQSEGINKGDIKGQVEFIKNLFQVAG